MFGRNNINVVDLLYTHTFNPVLSFASESLYGWQTNIRLDTGLLVGRPACRRRHGPLGVHGRVPDLHAVAAGHRHAARRAVRRLRGIGTGFKGIYTEVTGGLAVKLRPGLIVRPELRRDSNGQPAFNPVDTPARPVHRRLRRHCAVVGPHRKYP